MKTSFYILKSATLLIVLAMIAGCQDDPDDPIIPTGPSLTLQSGSNIISGDATVVPGEAFTLRVRGTAGSSPMVAVSVYDNNSLLPLNRLQVNNATPGANPFLLSAFEAQSFTLDITINAHVTESTHGYAVEVRDENQLTGLVSVNITTEDPRTPVVEMTGLQLFNAGGPPGTGGINLFTGMSTGSADPNAQLRDLGIDTDLPPAQNWRQMIAPINDAVLHIPPVGLVYDDIEFVEDIIAAFDDGVTIQISDFVQVGDLFVVRQNDDYFFLLVTDVVVTSADNNDYYMFDVKK